MSRFEPIQFCANIEQYKVTVALVVPPILVVLARHPGTLYAILNTKSNTHIGFSAVDKYDLSSVRIIFSGAAPLGAALTRQVIS